jgi:hypothetical protein
VATGGGGDGDGERTGLAGLVERGAGFVVDEEGGITESDGVGIGGK